MMEEKSQKRLKRQECVMDGQMYSQTIAQSSLPWQCRLKNEQSLRELD